MSQDEVLRLLKLNPRGLTINELAEKMDITGSSVHSNLAALRKWKLVEPIANTNPMRWKLIHPEKVTVTKLTTYSVEDIDRENTVLHHMIHKKQMPQYTGIMIALSYWVTGDKGRLEWFLKEMVAFNKENMLISRYVPTGYMEAILNKDYEKVKEIIKYAHEQLDV